VRPELQAGIAQPQNLGKTFRALVRFSNSEPKNVSDYGAATTGLAVKVQLDTAPHAREDFLLDRAAEQDFIAGGLDAFVAHNIADYAELFSLRIHPYANALAIKRRHPEAFAVFGSEPLLRWLRLTNSKAPLALEKPYSSLLPYAWGNAAVKYRFEPCHVFDRDQFDFSRFDRDYQSKILTEFLQKQDICYVMKVQARPPAQSAAEPSALEQTFPIEDAIARWPEPESTAQGAAFHEVARLQIKRGTPPLDAQTCERLALNPWHGLKAHQPLGSLSRARLAVYRKSEQVRAALPNP
jgi:hypothetical protein